MTTQFLVADSATMFRRQLRHLRRYPSLTLFVVLTPVVLLLLFVYVFGGALGAGLGSGAASGSRDAYVTYVTPGILLFAVVGSLSGTTIAVAMDMSSGIVARFRTMAIARASVLTGHVLGGLVQALLAVGATFAVAVLIGFRSGAPAADWLAAIGLLLLVGVAFTWLAVVLAMMTRSVETASNLPMLLFVLLLLSSGFVPTASMPGPLQWFADHQPVTPIIETLRALMVGTPGGDLPVSVAWCLLITLACAAVALRRYERRSTT